MVLNLLSLSYRLMVHFGPHVAIAGFFALYSAFWASATAMHGAGLGFVNGLEDLGA